MVLLFLSWCVLFVGLFAASSSPISTAATEGATADDRNDQQSATNSHHGIQHPSCHVTHAKRS